MAQGLRDSTTGALDRRVNATHVVTGADGWSPTDVAVAKDLAATPGVEGVTGVRMDGALAFGDKEIVNSVDPRTVGGLFTFDWADGDDAVLTHMGAGDAIVDEGWAKEQKLGVGDRFSITSPKGDELALTVRGIEESPVIDAFALGPITISQPAFEKAFDSRLNTLTFVKADAGADLISTSVITQSAPRTAFLTSSPITTAPFSRLTQSRTPSSGRSSSGQATLSSKPKRAAACIQETATLLQSPTQATARPLMGPLCSSKVMISAMTWQGWLLSVRPLMTGMVA